MLVALTWHTLGAIGVSGNHTVPCHFLRQKQSRPHLSGSTCCSITLGAPAGQASHPKKTNAAPSHLGPSPAPPPWATTPLGGLLLPLMLLVTNPLLLLQQFMHMINGVSGGGFSRPTASTSACAVQVKPTHVGSCTRPRTLWDSLALRQHSLALRQHGWHPGHSSGFAPHPQGGRVTTHCDSPMPRSPRLKTTTHTHASCTCRSTGPNERNTDLKPSRHSVLQQKPHSNAFLWVTEPMQSCPTLRLAAARRPHKQGASWECGCQEQAQADAAFDISLLASSRQLPPGLRQGSCRRPRHLQQPRHQPPRRVNRPCAPPPAPDSLLLKGSGYP